LKLYLVSLFDQGVDSLLLLCRSSSKCCYA